MSTTRFWGRLTAIAAILVLLSCVTINVYFPAAEVEAAADRIVEEVYGTEDEAPASPTSLRRLFPRFFGTTAAYAEMDIDVSTPAIRALRASLEARHAKLERFYGQGAVGIDRSGYLALRDVAGLGLQDKAAVNKLVQAENTDRKALYREIVTANNLDPADVAEVERIFAARWLARARADWWIQAADGTWKHKPAK